ncbi:PPE family protein [Mycobacterium camsae]|uniref:PPE family protein n=1 Tax=Mycobacterium gordonae TaxID=1778 RepID=UPI00197F2EAE|nr:PPE family protein [Mycobacterium gordonae]
MTAALDFAALPPEINSARMYTGPGSGPMLAAASAWKGLAAELRATALSFDAVLATLTGQEWLGPASAAMAAAAVPQLGWMSATAAQAEQTAAQAEAAAVAFEAAFAATVPPPLIAANRVQLAMLVATNLLGQNTPAIAATEAQYFQMWAQDAAAMYGYAGSSATATELHPFAAPQEATDPGGLAAQAVAVTQAAGASGEQSTLSQLISAVPAALKGLAGTNGLAGQGFWADWGPNANVWNTLASSGLMVPGSTFGSFLGMLNGAAAADAADGAAAAVGNAVAGSMGSTRVPGGIVSAGAGNSGAVGKLSVPPAWTAATPLTSPLHSALGGTPMVAPPPSGSPGMPGLPMGNTNGQHYGRAVPQYGFRSTVIARSPAAG